MGPITQSRARAAISGALTEKKTLIAILLIVVYAAINGVLLYFHEPWGDEAQAWLIARDLGFWEIPSLMRYEGHPCMWHWILYPFAHMGFPYITLNIVSYVIMLAATAFMIWKAPFPIWVKALFALSPCLTYFYPVIARSYCLIPPILFALAYFYPSRMTHPCRYTLLIALLVQTHVIMAMMAFMLSLLLLIECSRDTYATRNRRKAAHYFLALLIPLASAAFLLYILRSVETASAYNGIKQIGIGNIIVFLTTNRLLSFAIVIFAAVVVLKRTAAAVFSATVVAAVSICFQAWIYIAVHHITTQRQITAILIMVWAYWIIHDDRNGSRTVKSSNHKYEMRANLLCNILMVLLFAAMIAKYTLPEATRDIRQPYSNSKDAAKFINANIPKDAILLADEQFWASAVIPYINQPKMVYCSTMSGFSFVINDVNKTIMMDYEDFKSMMSTYDSSKVPVYLISDAGRSDVTDNHFSEDYELVYKSEVKSHWGENYEIYKIH